MEDKQAPQLIDVAAAAALLGTTPGNLRQMVLRRRVPFVKLGPYRNSRVLFDVDELRAWIEAHKVLPDSTYDTIADVLVKEAGRKARGPAA